jgi:hypothetical protein
MIFETVFRGLKNETLGVLTGCRTLATFQFRVVSNSRQKSQEPGFGSC